MIFIRPIIIDTEWDFDNITKRQEKIFKDKSKMKLVGSMRRMKAWTS